MGFLSLFFHVVAYVFNLFIPFWLFESSTDDKSKQVREPEGFRTVVVLFMILTQGQVFRRVSVTVVTCQETLTILTTDRDGQVSFPDS